MPLRLSPALLDFEGFLDRSTPLDRRLSQPEEQRTVFQLEIKSSTYYYDSQDIGDFRSFLHNNLVKNRGQIP